jgi:secreted trypsin-like serine protease
MSLLLAFGLMTATPVLQDPKLIGGKPVEDGDYPEVVYITAGSSRCTATVVGPRTLLTAGHCTKDRGVISFSIGLRTFAATCKVHPNFIATQLADDAALCKTEIDIPVVPASVYTGPILVGTNVTLMGYGCIQIGGGGGNDGILRYGRASVTRAASANYHWYETNAPVALCSGDSGGPNFDGVSHTVIGINSRGNLRNMSMFTSLTHIREWLSHAENICGIDRDCGRDGATTRGDCAFVGRFYDWLQLKSREYRARYERCEESGEYE